MLTAPLFVAAALVAPPYPSFGQPATSLFVLSSESRTPADLLCLDSLAELIAAAMTGADGSCSCKKEFAPPRLVCCLAVGLARLRALPCFEDTPCLSDPTLGQPPSARRPC